jgi:hypothetical protein
MACLALAALFPLPAAAQSACRVLDVEIAGAYSGGCKDGLAEGYGEAKGAAEYHGKFYAGRTQGKGIKTWSSGDRYAGHWADDQITGMPTPAMIARARAKTETLAAVAKPGVKVCRTLLVGIAVHDWIRGVVTAVDADRVEVRIDDPGQQPHVIDQRPLVKGLTFWSAAEDWKPCI